MMDPKIKLDHLPVANPAVISREGLNNDLILVNCDTGESLALNSTGKIVWDLIKMRYDTPYIISSIKERFKNVPESINDEVKNLLSILAEGGFIGYEIEKID